jgi:ribose/xylose/arabinose/galactoside ABC-type transport system permease subunit
VKTRGLSQSIALLIVIAAVAAVTTAVNPRFIRVQNLVNILQQVSILGIVACGVGMLLVSGNIDISVGSQISFMGIVTALVINGMFGGEPGTKVVVPAWRAALAIPLAVAVTVALGFLVGLVNGLVVVKSRVASFIITLGFLTVYHGAALVAGKGTGYPVSPRFEQLGRGRLFDVVPVPVLIFLAAIGITAVVLKYFRYGRKLYAIGGNRKAAFVSGIGTGRLTVAAFVVVGLCDALAALILVSRVGLAQSNISDSYALDALAAVVVGGMSITGGKGSAVNILLGVLLIGLISNALIIMRVSPNARDLVMGGIVIAAVSLSQRGAERA